MKKKYCKDTTALCIYHSADMDGRASAAMIYRSFNAYCDGYNYNRPVDVNDYLSRFPNLKKVWVVDYSLEENEIMDFLNSGISIVWCDHHKTAIKKFADMEIGKLIHFDMDTVSSRNDIYFSQYLHHYNNVYVSFEVCVSLYYSGCELTYYWLARWNDPARFISTCKDVYRVKFIDGLHVANPIIHLLGRYDVWDHSIGEEEWNKALDLQMFFRNKETWPNSPIFDEVFLGNNRENYFEFSHFFNTAIEEGRTLRNYQDRVNSVCIKSWGFTIKWEGVRFLAMNGTGNSLLAESAFDPDSHDAILYFIFDPKNCKWKFSLFHSSKSNPELDLSVIALKYGGGGHKGACGFSLKEIPFDLSNVNK